MELGPVPLVADYQGFVLIAVCAICFPLLLFCVILRSYVRIWVPRSFAWDDVACLLATIGTLSYAAVFLSSVNVAGRALWSLPTTTYSTRIFQELVFAYETIYGPTVFFAKLSLFLLLLRLLSPNRRTRLLIYFGIFCTFVYYMTTAIIATALCAPRNGESWPEALLSSRCAKATVMAYVQGIFNIVSDFYILVLPVSAISKLQLSFHGKVGLCAIFMTGFLACIASSLGLYYRILVSRDGDWTLHEVGLASATIVELTLGIICGCMPYLAPTLKSWQSKFKDSMSHIGARFSRRSTPSKETPRSHPMISWPNQGHHCETRILGSPATGGGRLLGSRNTGQRDWYGRRALSQEGYGQIVIQEWCE